MFARATIRMRLLLPSQLKLPLRATAIIKLRMSTATDTIATTSTSNNEGDTKNNDGNVKNIPTATPESAPVSPSSPNATGKSRRLGPKRKIAVLIAYNGSEFAGSQIQHGGIYTVESALLKAFIQNQAISEDNATVVQKVHWHRAARTDKGVHAAGNLISFSAVGTDAEKGDENGEFLSKVNKVLPSSLRCLAYTRVMNTFHAKMSCSSRTYEYILPSYALELSTEEERARIKEVGEYLHTRHLRKYAAQHSSQSPSPTGESESPKSPVNKRMRLDSPDNSNNSESEGEENGDAEDETLGAAEQTDLKIDDATRSRLLSYRISPERLAEFNSILAQYVGTRNFYNFTRHKMLKDREGRGQGQPWKWRDENPNKPSDASKPPSVDPPVKPTPASSTEPRKHLNFRAGRNNRHIKECFIAETFTQNNMEFLRIKIHGASFMLNQIRKMIGVAVALMREWIPMKVFPSLFLVEKLYVPTAPSNGLLLDFPHFDHYDLKCLDPLNASLNRETIDSMVQRAHKQREEFAYSKIYPTITSEEMKNLNFYRWLNAVGLHPSLYSLPEASSASPDNANTTSS